MPPWGSRPFGPAYLGYALNTQEIKPHESTPWDSAVIDLCYVKIMDAGYRMHDAG
jgi:hypothetical protein